MTRVDTPSDVMTLAGRLADRDGLNISDCCPIEHALKLIGTHSALVLLREAFWVRVDSRISRAARASPNRLPPNASSNWWTPGS